MEEKNYLVSGMHCAGCAAKVERAVEGLEGVERVELNLLTGRMTVLFEKPDSPARGRIASVVEKAGFHLADWREEPFSGADGEESQGQEETGGSRLVWSVLLLAPLMYLSMGPMWHWPVPGGGWGLWMNLWAQCILAAAILWLNRHYLINGVRQLAALSPNMDSLIAIGSGSAFLYGLYLLIAALWQGANVDGMELYFESAAMIVTLISLGKYLERRSYRKTNAAVKGLVKLVPQEALVWHDGAERAVPLDELHSGDLVVVKTGQRIPVDGVIEEGQAALDESDLTGESMPVDKTAGDRVISGTFNRAGYLKVRAERVGRDSTLARMIRLVEDILRLSQLVQGSDCTAGGPGVLFLCPCGDCHCPGVVGCVAGCRGGIFLRSCQGDCGAGDFLPLRSGACHAHRHHGRDGQGRAAGHPVQVRRSFGGFEPRGYRRF